MSGRWRIPKNLKGAGDLAHAIAHPVAEKIDDLTKGTPFETDLKNCRTCGQRREDWNAAVPFG